MSWIYFLVIGFWSIVFVIAVVMTRRALHGVGEPLADETGDSQASGANGHIQGAETASTGPATPGGARG